HLGAVGIVEEDLPRAGADLAAADVLDIARLQRGKHRGEPARGECHMVYDAGLEIALGPSAADVQDRSASRIEPCPGEVEVWARSGRKPEYVAIEGPRSRHVVGENVEVVHAFDGHGKILRCASRSRCVAEKNSANSAVASGGSASLYAYAGSPPLQA